MSIYISKVTLLYASFLILLIGAVMGSFLNCTAWRIAHGGSSLRGRSHCPSCGHVLGAADLIPVFSWLFLKGKCRYCKTAVPVRYPLTEILLAVLSLLCLLRFDLSFDCLRNIILCYCLFTLSLVDLESYRIPDACLVVAFAAWLLLSPLMGYSLREMGINVLAGLVYGGVMLLLSIVFDKITGKESLGGGDIKLFAIMGLYLGFIASLFALLLACIAGLIFAVVQKKMFSEKGDQIPFGPSIAIAFWLMLLYGQPFVHWYIGLLI